MSFKLKCSLSRVNTSNIIGKKILNLGYDRDVFMKNKLATPYFNMELSKLQLQHLNHYDNLTRIYSNFHNDFPDVIIDSKDWMPSVMDKIPLLENEYKRLNGDFYIRKSQ